MVDPPGNLLPAAVQIVLADWSFPEVKSSAYALEDPVVRLTEVRRDAFRSDPLNTVVNSLSVGVPVRGKKGNSKTTAVQ